MATYYVDGTNGSATPGSDGVNANDAWDTINHCLDGVTVDATDIVWVAPGIYRELVQLNDSGTDADNHVSIRGDSNCTQSWTSSIPGIVRITAADSNEVPQDNEVIDFNDKNYVSFYDFHIDGSSGVTAYLVAGDYGVEGRHLERCVCIGGDSAGYRISANNCVFMGTNYSVDDCSIVSAGKITNSLLIGRVHRSLLHNCIILSGSNGLYECSGYNNILIGGYVALRGGTSENYRQMYNNIIMGCYQAVSDNDNTQMGGNIMYASDDVAADDETDFSTNDNRQVMFDTTCTNPPAQGHMLNFPDAMTMIRGMAQAFKFSDFNDYDIDDTNATTEIEDIEGRTRPMRSNGETADHRSPGPCEIPDVVIQNASKIKIRKIGEEILYVPVENGTDVNISVDVDSTDQTTTRAKIELHEPDDDDGGYTLISGATDQATQNDDTLSISGNPSDHDKICILKLITLQNTGSTDFSNITIS